MRKKGKTYKKGNRAKRPKNRGRKNKYHGDNIIYEREQKINKMIKDFMWCTHTIDPMSLDDYDMMYAKKTDIKRLLRVQQGESYKMNHRRYQFLEEQINWFKKIYISWKKMTCYIFLSRRMNVPSYLIDNFYCDKNVWDTKK